MCCVLCWYVLFILTYHASLETRLSSYVAKNWQVVFQEHRKKGETDTKSSPSLMKYKLKGMTIIIIKMSSHAYLIFNPNMFLTAWLIVYFIKIPGKFSPAHLSSLQNSLYYVTWGIQPLSLDKSFSLSLWVFFLHSVSVVTVDNMDTKSIK